MPSETLRPPLEWIQQFHVLLMLETPELCRVFQMGSHKSRVDEKSHLL